MLTPDCENSFIYAHKSRECQFPLSLTWCFFPLSLFSFSSSVSSDVAVVDSSISINNRNNNASGATIKMHWQRGKVNNNTLDNTNNND